MNCRCSASSVQPPKRHQDDDHDSHIVVFENVLFQCYLLDRRSAKLRTDRAVLWGYSRTTAIVPRSSQNFARIHNLFEPSRVIVASRQIGRQNCNVCIQFTTGKRRRCSNTKGVLVLSIAENSTDALAIVAAALRQNTNVNALFKTFVCVCVCDFA